MVSCLRACSVGCYVLIFVTIVGLIFARKFSAMVTTAEIEADSGSWVRTPKDGPGGERLIEYFTCGAARADAKHHMLYMHGYGHTGKLGLSTFCHEAEALGFRVISPTQPGFGLSSHYPLGVIRTLKEWPADVKLILEKEKVDKFYASAASAGCVHVLTVAHALSDRVLGIGLGTPTTPLEVEDATMAGGMDPVTKYVRMANAIPWVGDLLSYSLSLMSAQARMEAVPDVAAAVVKMQSDTSVAWHKHVVESFLADQERGTIKGHRGLADNAHTINENFPKGTLEGLEKLVASGRKLVLTSAPDDTTNPPVMQQWYIDHIKGSQLIHRPAGYGHLHSSVPGCMTLVWRAMLGESIAGGNNDNDSNNNNDNVAGAAQQTESGGKATEEL
ncbi:unnamed protein product [Polarella glacialis]|uniref:AB hydrolase-1 domain-containing protein n=1 Tax=Polarella glacialis TaxID=89957 RepID=A0A813F5L2_POLGL|nr:unnamed protein product [Polarella glacialis]CAE8667773.1 unnamed protein product [Polarella glacialis]